MSRNPTLTWAGLLLSAAAVAACSDPSTTPMGLADRPAASGGTLSSRPGLASPGWQEQARTLVAANNLSPLAAVRIYASLSVAQYRAVAAVDRTHASKAHHTVQWRARHRAETRRGAVAGASAQVLSFFFPAAAADLERRLEEGSVHPAFTRGVAIGREAGNLLIERARSDGVTVPWTGTVPVGPGFWLPNGPPAGATFGNVKPYFLTSGSQFRSPPPPVFGSAHFHADLDEIRNLSLNRTPEQLAIAHFWNFPNGTYTPPGYWNELAANYVEQFGLDERAATHVLALMHAAMFDAGIGCWDTKYFYWYIRPSQADPTITLPIGLPNHPSYPSGHSCFSSAAVTVLAHFFPNRARQLSAWQIEAGLSRMYGGIHYRFDITSGAALGTAVARRAIRIDKRAGLLSVLQ